MTKSTKELIALYEKIGMQRWADELKALFPSGFVGEFAVYRGVVL